MRAVRGLVVTQGSFQLAATIWVEGKFRNYGDMAWRWGQNWGRLHGGCAW
jgi:hypothetical protein